MTWEDKTEMIRHFNCDEHDKALDVVIKNLEVMDDQAWDMFFTAVSLTDESILEHIEKHKIIYPKTVGLTTGSIRTSLRMAAYELRIEKFLIIQ